MKQKYIIMNKQKELESLKKAFELADSIHNNNLSFKDKYKADMKSIEQRMSTSTKK